MASSEVELLSAPKTPPAKEKEPDAVLCNCYLFVKKVFTSLPSTHTILSNVATSGPVAVFYYSSVGLHHYAVVLGETDDGYFIEETNYKECEHGTRIIPKDDPNLIGFFTPGL